MIYEQIIDDETLYWGWRRVKRNKGAPGGDGVSIERYEKRLDENLITLKRSLISGTYEPGPMARFPIKKTGGGERWLAIPSMADRVIQAAAALVLNKLLDPLMSDASFAFRRGRSVEHAIGRVITYQLWGRKWVVDGDIKSYFDSIPHQILLKQLNNLISCPLTIRLIEIWLMSFSDNKQGIAQGSPISPLLANIYLTPIDMAIESKKVRLVRYADDFLLLTSSKDGAIWAKQRIAVLLKCRGLQLNGKKTKIASFDGGFSFLGYSFSNGCFQKTDDHLH